MKTEYFLGEAPKHKMKPKKKAGPLVRFVLGTGPQSRSRELGQGRLKDQFGPISPIGLRPCLNMNRKRPKWFKIASVLEQNIKCIQICIPFKRSWLRPNEARSKRWKVQLRRLKRIKFVVSFFPWAGCCRTLDVTLIHCTGEKFSLIKAYNMLFQSFHARQQHTHGVLNNLSKTFFCPIKSTEFWISVRNSFKDNCEC